jgi:hypothetical protein
MPCGRQDSRSRVHAVVIRFDPNSVEQHDRIVDHDTGQRNNAEQRHHAKTGPGNEQTGRDC